jgi:hypothetical protein
MRANEILKEGLKGAAIGSGIAGALGTAAGGPVAGAFFGSLGGILGHSIQEIFKQSKHPAPPNSSRQLAQRFANLGNMKGMTLEEVVAGVGIGPNSMSTIGPGQILYQWQTVGANFWSLKGHGYHVAILFVDNKVEAVTHEFLTDSKNTTLGPV